MKVGGRYRMDDGHIVVDSIEPIALTDVTYDLARESGFDSVDDLLHLAKHGRGDNVYMIRFHYLPPGGWDTGRWITGGSELIRAWFTESNMASSKQRAAARRNIKKAAQAARRKRTIANLPKKTRTALGKEGAKAARRKR